MILSLALLACVGVTLLAAHWIIGAVDEDDLVDPEEGETDPDL